MSTEYQKALGRKIAFHRKRRGLSQKEFAGLLGRSEAWVSQVERGVRRIDRMTVLEKVAEVLEVPIAELAAEAPIVASVAEGEPPGASRLRLVLSSAHSLKAILGRQDAPPDVQALRAEVDRAWSLTHQQLRRPGRSARRARSAAGVGNPLGVRGRASRTLPVARGHVSHVQRGAREPGRT